MCTLTTGYSLHFKWYEYQAPLIVTHNTKRNSNVIIYPHIKLRLATHIQEEIQMLLYILIKSSA